MISLKNDDNVNVAEEDDSKCSVDPDPVIIPPTSKTVTETVILKMTKRAVTYNDGITDILRETDISHSDTIPAEDLDVFKFATEVSSKVHNIFKIGT